MLKPRKPENWQRLHIFSRRDTADDAEQESDPKVTQHVGDIAREAGRSDWASCTPLRRSWARVIGITAISNRTSRIHASKSSTRPRRGSIHGTLAG